MKTIKNYALCALLWVGVIIFNLLLLTLIIGVFIVIFKGSYEATMQQGAIATLYFLVTVFSMIIGGYVIDKHNLEQ